MPVMHLPDTCWEEAPVGGLPCSYHDLIRLNLQVHSRDDPHSINTTNLTLLAFTVPSSLLPPHLGSSSHPHFHILLGYSFLSSPFPPHLAFSLFSSIFSIVPISSRLASSPFPLPNPSFILPSLLSSSLISLSYLGLSLGSGGVDSSGTDASLSISSTEPISAAVLCITSFTPLHISCLTQSGPCDPNTLFLWGDRVMREANTL